MPEKCSNTDQLAVLKIVAIYAVLGSLWIYFSDSAVGLLVADPAIMTRLATIKGLLFIVLTSSLLYFLIARLMSERRQALSALKKSEGHYRSIIELAADTILLGNIEGNIIGANKSASQLTGYPLEELLGMNISALFSQEEQKRVPLRYDLLREGKTIRSERILTRKHGSLVPIEMNTKMMPDGSYQTFIRDMTEHQLMQEELLRNQKLESLGVLAGGIAHDFNNILTGIVGNISFARRFLEESHQASQILAEAEKATQRATDLAYQLLTFAKGGQPIKTVISTRMMLVSSATLVLRGTNVKSVMECPDDLKAIDGDEGQLNQVFNNIIINAAQAMPNGGTITIRGENLSLDTDNGLGLDQGGYVRIYISDTGCGISEEDQKQIFDPYFTTKTGGSGLGLASARSIITKHGGHISCSSRREKGTTFEILLPASSQQASAIVGDNIHHPVPAGRGRRLLVMDDDEIIRSFVSDMLGDIGLGYQVDTCVNGERAIELYGEALKSGSPYAAVIMDLTIPGAMGGSAAVGEILKLDAQARVIVSSGYSNDPVMANYADYGFSAMILKPYRYDEMADTLNELLS